MKARAHLQQTGDASLHPHFPACRRGHTGENLQQSAFARAIAANDAEDFTLLDLKGNSAQRPHLVVAQCSRQTPFRGREGRDLLLSDLALLLSAPLIHLGIRVRFAANAVPPPFEIVTERACANDPQAILLPDVVNFNDSAH